MHQIKNNNFVSICEESAVADGYILGFNDGFVFDLEDTEDRRRRLRFHIEEGDYFATAATIFHIAAKEKNIDLKNAFEKLAEDFHYLQENYEIKKKLKK